MIQTRSGSAPSKRSVASSSSPSSPTANRRKVKEELQSTEEVGFSSLPSETDPIYEEHEKELEDVLINASLFDPIAEAYVKERRRLKRDRKSRDPNKAAMEPSSAAAVKAGLDFYFKVERFSLLPKSYRSSAFVAGGYRWYLLLYPGGCESLGGVGHITMFLAIEDTLVGDGWEVKAKFRIYIYNHLVGKYTNIEGDEGCVVKQFNKKCRIHGFSKLISLASFCDPLRGYLIEDTCVFGVEVSVYGEETQGELVSMFNNNDNIKGEYKWRIQEWSKINKEMKWKWTPFFQVGVENYKCRMRFVPKVHCEESKTDFSSVYFAFDAFEEGDEPLREKVYAKFRVSVVNQSNVKEDVQVEDVGWFTDASTRGWKKLMRHDVLADPANGFLVNDSLVIQGCVQLCGLQNHLVLDDDY